MRIAGGDCAGIEDHNYVEKQIHFSLCACHPCAGAIVRIKKYHAYEIVQLDNSQHLKLWTYFTRGGTRHRCINAYEEFRLAT